MQHFIADIRLLLTNALTFYDSGSEEYQWACELEQTFVQKLQEYGGWSAEPGEGGREGRGREGGREEGGREGGREGGSVGDGGREEQSG